MIKNIVFIADFFANEIAGGGELNNQELVNLLRLVGIKVIEIKCEFVTQEFLSEHKESGFIVSNFIALNEEKKTYLQKNCNYLIYEHDHKYLITRDPSIYPEYTASPDQIINFDFYKNAKGVICQSKMHASVVKKNLNLENIHSVGGNLWTSDVLETLRKFSEKEKQEKYSIWDSGNPIKNTTTARAYCKHNGFETDLVGFLPYKKFLDKITNNKYFVFFPKTLETLCRVVVECRMAGMTVITNKKIGALSEDWFKLKGPPLIDIMIKKRQEIPSLVIQLLDNK